MRITVDLASGKAVLARGTTQEITSLREKRCTIAVLEVEFVRGITVQELDASATGKFELKIPTRYDNPQAITGASAWTKFGTGTSTYYQFAYALINNALNYLFGVNAAAAFTATAATDVLAATAHGLIVNDIVEFSSDDTLPAGLNPGTDYHVIASGLTANAFKVSLTEGGTTVDITDTGTGTHQFVKVSNDIPSIALMGEISWREFSLDHKTQTINFTIENDVNRDGDTIPGSPAVVYSRDSFLRVDTGVPSNSLGIDGDAYIDSVTENFYYRVAGAYVLQFNIKGATGNPGGQFIQNYSSTTTDADPGSGIFRLNNATIASVTAAYLDNNETGGNAINAFLDTFDDSTATIKGYLSLRGITNPLAFALFAVTGSVVDGTGYRKLTLTHIASAGTFTSTNAFAFTFARAGDIGATGSAGSAGANGATPGITQNYSTTTTDSDPGPGIFRFNNATIASVTAAYLDNNESLGSAITGWLDSFDDSSSVVKGILTFKGVTTPAAFAVFKVTGSVVDGTGYRKLTLTYLASGGTFTNTDLFVITFAPTGDIDATSPINAQPNDYTFVLGDAGKTIYHANATPHTYTIPANGSVAYPVGTIITILNANGSGDITLAITTDTLRRGDGTAGTGSRTIPADSIAFIDKATSTVWYIGGAFS